MGFPIISKVAAKLTGRSDYNDRYQAACAELEDLERVLNTAKADLGLRGDLSDYSSDFGDRARDFYNPVFENFEEAKKELYGHKGEQLALPLGEESLRRARSAANELVEFVQSLS